MRKALMYFVPAAVILAQLACNLPSVAPASPPSSGATAPPVPAPQGQAPPPAAEAATATVTSTPVPQDQLVLVSTLCWIGPGDKYEVVSGLKKGERVKLLGKGSIPGWFIVQNPTYHDPCWAQAADLQIDPSIDQLSLQVFSPPLLKPTKTPKPSPTPV